MEDALDLINFSELNRHFDLTRTHLRKYSGTWAGRKEALQELNDLLEYWKARHPA